MMLQGIVVYVLLAIVAITLVDTLGAVASRKLNFKYAWLSFLSLAIYLLADYFIGKTNSQNITLIATSLIGFYDATAGWNYAMALKANHGLTEEQLRQLTPTSRVICMIGVAILFGSLGFYIGSPS